jgi:nucleoid DNA-binding protein
MAKTKATAGKSLTKSETYAKIAEATEKSRKEVAAFFEALTDVIKEQLSKKGSGVFTIPGLLKLRRVHKPATPAGMRKNPFTGQMQQMPAKPASYNVRARALKSLKEMIK